MFALLLLFACGEKADDTAEAEATDDCSGPYEEIEARGMPGWTPAAGCDVLCEEVDSGGLIYHGCYLTAEEAVICQYLPACG